MRKIFYLCNGQKEDCKKKDCFINGGRCRHTTDVRYAKNFKKNNPQVGTYWEKETVQNHKTASED